MGIAESENCEKCVNVKETIVHKFFECPASKEFWNQLKSLWETGLNEIIVINKENIVFGYYNEPQKVALNFCILYGKYYIYVQKNKSENINFVSFLHLLKRKILVYKHINAVNGKLQQFQINWSALLDAVCQKLA